MIHTVFISVDPGAVAFAQPLALYASQLIPNDFVGTPLGFMAGGAEVVGIGQGPSFRVSFYKVYIVSTAHNKNTVIPTVSVIRRKSAGRIIHFTIGLVISSHGFQPESIGMATSRLTFFLLLNVVSIASNIKTFHM